MTGSAALEALGVCTTLQMRAVSEEENGVGNMQASTAELLAIM
jgi:hypothetical protein